MLQTVVKAASALALAAFSIFATGVATADDALLESKLRACHPDGASIGGVNACGKIWKIKSGEIELKRDGDLEVEVKGLVLDDASTGEANGTAGDVTQVVASLVCGGTQASVVAESDRFSLNKNGKADTKVKLRLPSQCAAPAVLIRAIRDGKVEGWLAVTGF